MFGQPRYTPAAPPRKRLLQGFLAYNKPSRQQPNGRQAVFLPGSFRNCTGRIPLCVNHHEPLALGCALVEELPGGLQFTFALDPCEQQHARILSDLRADMLTGWSPTFAAASQVRDGLEVISLVDALREISLARRPEWPVCFTSVFLVEE